MACSCSAAPKVTAISRTATRRHGRRYIFSTRILESFGIEKERLEVVTAIDPQGEKIPGIINSFTDRLKGLRPMKS